jgi:hypothetical protein
MGAGQLAAAAFCFPLFLCVSSIKGEAMPTNLKIVVAGDVSIDLFIWRVNTKDLVDTQGRPTIGRESFYGNRMTAMPGGALLLARMFKEVAGINVIAPQLENLEQIAPQEIVHSLALLAPYPFSRGLYNRSHLVYRVQQFLGYVSPEKKPTKLSPIQGDDADAEIIVIDDAGKIFRDNKADWPKAIKSKGKHPLVVLQHRAPLGKGKLWSWIHEYHADRLVVVIEANDLRAMEGVDISRGLSWERTALDLVGHLVSSKSLGYLTDCRHLVVRFDLEGTVYYNKRENGAEARLFYDPELIEGDFHAEHSGTMMGLDSVFLATLVSQLSHHGLMGIADGICAGLLNSRKLLQNGFGSNGALLEYPVTKIFQPYPGKTLIASIEVPFPPPNFPQPTGHRSPWTILHTLTDADSDNIAFNVAYRGKDPILDRAPKAWFGHTLSIDPSEIESFRNIKMLLQEYISNPSKKKPISIAVFGPPGSGKRFTILQIVRSLNEFGISTIDFNLSQFNHSDDLLSAFQQVRDKGISNGLPFVFWQDFDTDMGSNPLGWLRYFLAPMQDGCFQEGQIIRPIGPAVFIFISSKVNNFEEFTQGITNQSFSSARGPDFISRLSNYVSVLGPNPGRYVDNKQLIIRRALMLRLLLQRYWPHFFDSSGKLQIDQSVLVTFLKVKSYKHGWRSMESVIKHSRLKGKTKFELSSLPPEETLSIHIERENGFREEGVSPFGITPGRQLEGVQEITPPIQKQPLVFISAKSEDYPHAKRVYDFLIARGVPTFFSHETLPELANADYRKEIDKALDNSEHMIVVVSRGDYARSPWVEAEWGFFINEKRSGRKPGNLITLTVGNLQPGNLPPSLRYYEAIPWDDHAFEKLLRYVIR